MTSLMSIKTDARYRGEKPKQRNKTKKLEKDK